MNFYAWEHDRFTLPGWEASFDRQCISALNLAAKAGLYDVVSVSSANYPAIAGEYWILSSGNSVGRGYGPVLVARDPIEIEALRGKRVAVGGLTTTGCALARLYCPDVRLVEMRYDRIADAVLAGDVDGGVMIHEELLHYVQMGLHRVCDLGATWCQETRLPLTVGLNVVHHRVGRKTASDIASVCRRSLQWGMEHPDEAVEYAARFGRGCANRFVEMFSNHDTLSLPADAVEALHVMFARVAHLGLGPKIEAFEVICG
jgi:1,4-dihydroxy-6-naphthoate synthase